MARVVRAVGVVVGVGVAVVEEEGRGRAEAAVRVLAMVMAEVCYKAEEQEVAEREMEAVVVGWEAEVVVVVRVAAAVMVEAVAAVALGSAVVTAQVRAAAMAMAIRAEAAEAMAVAAAAKEAAVRAAVEAQSNSSLSNHNGRAACLGARAARRSASARSVRSLKGFWRPIRMVESSSVGVVMAVKDAVAAVLAVMAAGLVRARDWARAAAVRAAGEAVVTWSRSSQRRRSGFR